MYEHIKIRDIVLFLHKCAFAPVKSTWLKAVQKGFFTTWPGLTAEAIKKYLDKQEDTVKGHLHRQRMNVRSTKKKNDHINEDGIDDEIFDLFEPKLTEKTHHVYAMIAERKEIFTDVTGGFPVLSNVGNRYIFILYAYDQNAIKSYPIRNRTKGEIKKAYATLLNYFKQRGITPKLQKLDNEASKELKEYIKEEGITYQLVQPHLHRRNAAERAIQTWKNHFIAGLCACDPMFPLRLWDKLLEQCDATLNMMRPSRINPKVSAYTQLEGVFDFNATPLAPPGMRAIVFESPEERQSWSPHGVDGWYVGPALEHYRCYTVVVNDTAAPRHTDTLALFPAKVQLPIITSKEAVQGAAVGRITGQAGRCDVFAALLGAAEVDGAVLGVIARLGRLAGADTGGVAGRMAPGIAA